MYVVCCFQFAGSPFLNYQPKLTAVETLIHLFYCTLPWFGVKCCHPLVIYDTAYRTIPVFCCFCVVSLARSGSYLFFCSSHLAQPDLDIGMSGHNFTQQQAPPNQTAPWPESMMPIEQTFASRYSSNLIQFLFWGVSFFTLLLLSVEHHLYKFPFTHLQS